MRQDGVGADPAAVIARIRHWASGLLDPLALAAYVAWAAVWVGTGAILARQDPAALLPARLLMLGFLAAFIVALRDQDTRPRWRFDLALLGQLGCSLGLLWLGAGSGTAPVLLVLLAAMLAARFRALPLLLVLAGVNLVVAVIMRWQWQADWGWIATSLAGYASFQAFAALLMRSANRAEAASEALRAVNADLLATRSLLAESARDSERLRLSRELHDVAGHKLTALKLNLRQLQREPALEGNAALQTSATLADELLDDLRAVVRELRRHDGLDLGEALRQLAAPLPRPRVQVQVDEDARAPDAARAEALLWVAQEALTNAARHSGARQAWLHLAREPAGLRLSVEDDGRVQWPPAPGNGLRGMRERLVALGGELVLANSPHGGLKVMATLPQEIDA